MPLRVGPVSLLPSREALDPGSGPSRFPNVLLYCDYAPVPGPDTGNGGIFMHERITIHVICGEFNISPREVRRYVAAGVIPPPTLGLDAHYHPRSLIWIRAFRERMATKQTLLKAHNKENPAHVLPQRRRH